MFIVKKKVMHANTSEYIAVDTVHADEENISFNTSAQLTIGTKVNAF